MLNVKAVGFSGGLELLVVVVAIVAYVLDPMCRWSGDAQKAHRLPAGQSVYMLPWGNFGK